VSGSGICWTIYKSAPHHRQTTMPTSHHSVFYRPDALPAAQPTASKHWRHKLSCLIFNRSVQSNLASFHIAARQQVLISAAGHLWALWYWSFSSSSLAVGPLLRCEWSLCSRLCSRVDNFDGAHDKADSIDVLHFSTGHTYPSQSGLFPWGNLNPAWVCIQNNILIDRVIFQCFLKVQTQCCSNFIDPDAICWSFFNSSWYLMIPFIFFIHQFFHVLLPLIFNPFLPLVLHYIHLTAFFQDNLGKPAPPER